MLRAFIASEDTSSQNEGKASYLRQMSAFFWHHYYFFIRN